MTIEEYRTLSKLTNRPHLFIDGNKKLVAFGGIILTLGIFSMIFMWTITKTSLYSALFKEHTHLLEECVNLNPNINLGNAKDIGATLVYKFHTILASLENNELIELIDNLKIENSI